MVFCAMISRYKVSLLADESCMSCNLIQGTLIMSLKQISWQFHLDDTYSFFSKFWFASLNYLRVGPWEGVCFPPQITMDEVKSTENRYRSLLLLYEQIGIDQWCDIRMWSKKQTVEHILLFCRLPTDGVRNLDQAR